MMRPMDDLRSQLTRWWRPLVTLVVGLALFAAAALASARQDDAVASRLEATAARAEARVGAALTRVLTAAEVMAGATVVRDVTEPFTASTAGLEPSPVRMWQTWLPLVTGDRTQPQAVVEVDHDRAAVLAGAGESAARLATTLQVLAIVALILAAALAVMTGL